MPLGPAPSHSFLQSHLQWGCQSGCAAHFPKCCNLEGSRPAFFLSYAQGWFMHTLVSRACSTVMPNQGAGPALPCATAHEEGMACSHTLQANSPNYHRWQARRKSASPLHPHHLKTDEGEGQLSHALALEARSPVPLHQGHLYSSIQVRCRVYTLVIAVANEG